MSASKPTGRDALLPAALLAIGAAELVLSGLPQWGWGVAFQGLACAVLVWRRALPLVAGPVAAWIIMIPQLIDPALSEPATPIAVIVVACYSCARYRSDLWGIASVLTILASAFPRYLLGDATNDITDLVFIGALLVPPFAFGRIARQLDEQAHQLADQARLLGEQQEALQRQAILAERDRIARELHDVIAHSISAMVVQTAAAQDLVDTDPDRARTALGAVAATGRRTLAETGRLLRLIRDDADELGLEPVPGLADLGQLVEGGDVELRCSGDLSGLPAAVDVSAYRIVQESLTNARRYGQGPLSVSVERHDGLVRIRTANAVDATASQGGGLGLVGMAERASVLGGTLTHGVRDGRFELEAVLPVVHQ